MSFIKWRKKYNTVDDTEILPAQSIADIQNDVASKVNGGLTDTNISATAAIVESKVAYDVDVGHDHNGTNSRELSTVNQTTKQITHLRQGLTVTVSGIAEFTIQPGYVMIGSTFLEFTSPQTLDFSDSDNFINGSESASKFFFVYIRNSGTTSSPIVEIVISDEAPDLSDISENTAEFPIRYQKYNESFYRCLGGAFNNVNSDLIASTAVSFDQSSMIEGTRTGDGNDITVTTIWTPTYVIVGYVDTDTTPTTTSTMDFNQFADGMGAFWVRGFNDTSNDNEIQYEAPTDFAGGIKTHVDQSTGTPGSFIIHAPETDKELTFLAFYAGGRGA